MKLEPTTEQRDRGARKGYVAPEVRTTQVLVPVTHCSGDVWDSGKFRKPRR